MVKKGKISAILNSVEVKVEVGVELGKRFNESNKNVTLLVSLQLIIKNKMGLVSIIILNTPYLHQVKNMKPNNPTEPNKPILTSITKPIFT